MTDKFFVLSDIECSNEWFESKVAANEWAHEQGYALLEYSVLDVVADFDDLVGAMNDGAYEDEAIRTFASEIVGWHYVADYDSWDDLIGRFQDAYAGEYVDATEWAETFVAELGIFSGVDEMFARYFDYAAYGRDAELSGDISFHNGHAFYGQW